MKDIIIPTGTLIISATQTFTILLPAMGDRHFLKCCECESVEPHRTEDILNHEINHRCRQKNSIHHLLEPYITNDMLDTEQWLESKRWDGYCVSSLGRIMRTTKERVLSPSSATADGKIFYVVRDKGISNLDIVEEYLELMRDYH